MAFITASGNGRLANPILSIDLSLLAFRPPPSIADLNTRPAVIPPWQLDDSRGSDRLLLSQANAVRRLSSLVNPGAPGVDAAGVTPDSRATFVLFDALSKLGTLARFAASPEAAGTSLDQLDARFRKGLDEILGYVSGLDLDLLTLLPGSRTSSTTSPVRLGSNVQSFTGQAVATEGRDDPLPGLLGDEVFTLSLTRFDETTDIVIDLSEITGTLSITAVVDHINARIAEIPALDETGAPRPGPDGTPLSRFSTRLAVATDANFDHAIRINTTLFEQVSLVPAGGEPDLFAVSDSGALLGGTASAALARFGDAAGSIDPLFRNVLDGVDGAATALADEGESVSAPTRAAAVAIDSDGFIYTLGSSSGDFGSQLNQSGGAGDVFLTKTDSAGNVVFSRLLGAADSTEGFALAIDSQDNVIVTGRTRDNLAPGALISGDDAFVAKFSSRGDRVFTYQLDRFAASAGVSVTLDANDDIILTGFTAGAIDAATPSGGGRDTLVLRLDGASGAKTDAAVFGGAGNEEGRAVALAQDGNVLVASVENGRAVLRKLDVADLSRVIFEQDLGALGSGGGISGIAVEGSSIFLAGTTVNAAFANGAATTGAGHAGDRDGFVLRLSDGGSSASLDFRSFVGTSSADTVEDIVVSGGTVFLAGSTRGDLGGSGRNGPRDGFVLRMDATTGTIGEVEQFGQVLTETVTRGLALAPNGASVLDRLGLPTGDVERAQSRTVAAQTTARAGDFFELVIDDRRSVRITLAAGDTFADLERKIERATLQTDVEASILQGEFSIRAAGDHVVELRPGSEGRDLLAHLGIEPARLLGTGLLFGLGEDGAGEDKLGGVFGLELDRLPGIRDKKSAEFTLTRIEAAIETVKRAFRSLTPSVLDRLNRPTGTVPTRITNQLANYTAALRRLQGGIIDTTTGFRI